MEGLGRIKKREAGVEAMFQDVCFFLCLGLLFSLSHVVFHFVLFSCVSCTHARDVCCFVTMQGCICFGLMVGFGVFYDLCEFSVNVFFVVSKYGVRFCMFVICCS